MRRTNSALSIFQKKWQPPGNNLWENIFAKLSLTERFFLYSVLIVFIFSGLSLLWQVNMAFLVEVPASGGSISEGVIGTPRAINPLLASEVSDADKDLIALVYSGLLKATPEGELTHDLAKSYKILENGLVYEFTLKDNIYFHDGKPVTAEDIEFTVKKAQDQLIKSPRRINWEGVGVKVISEKQLKFILSEPFTPFLQNTTLGVLPKHLWKDLDSDQFVSSLLNLEPVGSGPYKIKSIKRGSNGLPIYYRLRAFSKYALGEPNIKDIYVKFFFNEEDLIEAFKKGQIENINSISPQKAATLKDGSILKTATLSRTFGIFFNHNQASLFANEEVRKALELSLDKEGLVRDVLGDYGVPLYSPIPPKYSLIDNNGNKNEANRVAEAREILEEGGWQFDQTENIWKKETDGDEFKLSFSISTGDTDDLKTAAQKIKEDWEKLGAVVDIKLFDLSDLKQNVIRTRKYDALFFGTIIGRDLDFYPFWHSSQRNDPGLNIALYTNFETDKLLEELRNEINQENRAEKYQKFEKLIIDEIPAVFAYSPKFIYLTPEKIKNIKLDFLTTSSERFLNVHEWYIDTNNVWRVFQ